MPPAERRPRDPAEKALREQEAQLARQTAISDLRWLMGDVRGRRFVHRLLEQAGIYRTTWDADARAHAFKEGARNFGIQYLLNELLEHCPKRLSEMQRENLKHERSSDSGTSTSGDTSSSGPVG